MSSPVEFFETRAADWEASCYPPPVRRRLEALMDEFDIQPCSHVLDVGTGPGILLPYLQARVGPEGRIWAFDLAFNMVRQAHRKTIVTCTPPDGECNTQPQHSVTGLPASLPARMPASIVIQADAHHLPFSTGQFDQVICFAAFPHFEQPETALREMSRVLRDGGGLIIAHLMSRMELAEHHGTHAAVADDVLPNQENMRRLFDKAQLRLETLVDMPGRYLAKGCKVVVVPEALQPLSDTPGH